MSNSLVAKQSPVRPTPVRSTPVRAAPVRANPARSTPARSAAGRGASGRPARAAPARPERAGTLSAGLLPRLIGYQLRLAQVAVFRDFERSVGALGVSPGRVGVMLLVEANPGLAQSRLAEAVELDRSTLVPVIDQLERAGWVERRAGPDRRTNGLWLTAAGRRFLTRVKGRIRAHEARIGAPLTAAERAELLRMLGLLQTRAG